MSNLATQTRTTSRSIPTIRNIGAITPSRLYINKPTPAELKFIEAEAKNFQSFKSQDMAHYNILNHLLTTTYANPATTDPFYTAYAQLRDSFKATAQGMRPNVTSLYLMNTAGVTASPTKGMSFIHDLIQIQANNVTVDNWRNISDTILNSPFQDAFNALVASLNTRLGQLGVAGKGVNFLNQMSHRDAIQLIPRNPLFAGELSGVKITGNVISSTGGLQGIFATDGLFRDITITGNHVNVGGAHSISINGLLSGEISGNVTNTPIKLLPLRIGGGANIYIVGFKKDSGYSYDAIKKSQPLQDQRKTPQAGGIHYTNVDMNIFYKELSRHRNNLSALMKLCGEPLQ